MTSVVEGYNELLEQYYDQMTILTSSMAYMVAPGNYEASRSLYPLAHPHAYHIYAQRPTVITGKPRSPCTYGSRSQLSTLLVEPQILSTTSLTPTPYVFLAKRTLLDTVSPTIAVPSSR